jgi:hypothetical protein
VLCLKAYTALDFSQRQFDCMDYLEQGMQIAVALDDNKLMAETTSMQGVDADSVRKTKQRLRRRLQIPVDGGLEEYIRDM